MSARKDMIKNREEETQMIQQQRDRIKNQVKEIKRHYEFMKQEAIKEMRYSVSASRTLAKKVKSKAKTTLPSPER